MTPAAPSPVQANPHAHQITSWRSVLLWPLAALFHLWGRTLRIEISPADRALATALERNSIAVDVVGPSGLPTRPELYQGYDSIILNDINAANTTPANHERKRIMNLPRKTDPRKRTTADRRR